MQPASRETPSFLWFGLAQPWEVRAAVQASQSGGRACAGVHAEIPPRFSRKLRPRALRRLSSLLQGPLHAALTMVIERTLPTQIEAILRVESWGRSKHQATEGYGDKFSRASQGDQGRPAAEAGEGVGVGGDFERCTALVVD
jgi:uncharacterized protein with PIN domain